MAADKKQRMVQALTLRLAKARASYARLRDKYSRSLIRWEARVQRLETDLEVLVDMVDAPGAGVRSVPLARANGAGRPVLSTHPFPRRVGNLTAWCKKNGYSRSFAKSWTAKNGSPIPESAAALILRQFGVKLASWPNGVRRG